MRRRDLCSALAISMGLPLVRVAQAEARIYRVGVLETIPAISNAASRKALQGGLQEQGYIEGQNLDIEYRSAEGYVERLAGSAKELIGLGADVLVAAGTQASRAAATANTAIPIVLVGVSNPSSIINSGGATRGNITGLSLTSRQLIVNRLQLLKELSPSPRRVAILVRDEGNLADVVADISSSARQLSFSSVVYQIASGSTVELTFAHLRNERCDAVYVASGPLGPAKRTEILALAAEAHLPAVYSYPEFTAGGGLMSLATDEVDLFRRAAGFVDRILKGQLPADIPIEEPSKFSLVVNLKTARRLGMTLPQALIARADEVIDD